MLLKDAPVKEVGCVSNEEVGHFQRHVNQLFPGISVGKLQRALVYEI